MIISKQNSGRLVASLIFLTPIIVLFASSAMFYSGYSPQGTVNKGTLLDEPIELGELKLDVVSGPLTEEFPGKWSIVQFVSGDCTEKCWETLYSSRQINIRLAKNSDRVVRYLINVGTNNLSNQSIERISEEYPLLNTGIIDSDLVPLSVTKKLQDSPYILFDPLGNGILIYDSTLPSGELLEDIKKVLQNSKIG
jgi:cytochrome oxidase Cu insertion factor (SCO1/SenC/PrrC family)